MKSQPRQNKSIMIKTPSADYDTLTVGTKLEVQVNGVPGQAELFCVERTNNPIKLRFMLMYYGVPTGKEFVACKALNRWAFIH